MYNSIKGELYLKPKMSMCFVNYLKMINIREVSLYVFNNVYV